MPKKTSTLIASWEDYDFKLYRPTGTKTKAHIFFNFFDQKTGKNIRVRNFNTLTGNLSERKLIANAKVLAETYIDLLKSGYNPLTGAYSSIEVNSSSTIIECVNHYLDFRKKTYENKGIAKNRYDLIKIGMNHFIDWLKVEKYEYRKATSFTAIDIKAFFDKKTNQCAWGKQTFNTYRSDLKTFWLHLKALKVIKEVDVFTYVPHKNTRRDSSHFTVYEEEELKIVNSLLMADSSFYNLFVAAKLLYKYNIRLEEQLKIQIQDYDQKNRVLTLPATKTKNKDEAVFLLDEETAELLEPLLGNAPGHHYLFGKGSHPGDTRLKYGYFGQRWRTFREKYAYQLDENGNQTEEILISNSLKFYALKHSSSYYALQDGESLKELQKRLRHTLESTTRRYTENKLNRKPIVGIKDSRF